MIMSISANLEEVKNETNIDFVEIKKETFEIIKENIKNNLGVVIGDYSNFMWGAFPETSNITGEFAWEYVKDILPQEECYLFCNQIECRKAYLFKNSTDLCEVLAETSDWEFYVTDFEGTYIICYCHEEILIGCGKAKVWMDEFIKNNLCSHQDD